MYAEIILKKNSQNVLIISKNKNISFIYGHIFQHKRVKGLPTFFSPKYPKHLVYICLLPIIILFN